MEVRRLGEQIGAEILGIDVRALNESTWRTIYQTWIASNVLCIRDQTLELEQQTRPVLVVSHLSTLQVLHAYYICHKS